jgi:hypothetical protein
LQSGAFDKLRIKCPGLRPITPTIKKAARFTGGHLI